MSAVWSFGFRRRRRHVGNDKLHTEDIQKNAISVQQEWQASSNFGNDVDIQNSHLVCHVRQTIYRCHPMHVTIDYAEAHVNNNLINR